MEINFFSGYFVDQFFVFVTPKGDRVLKRLITIYKNGSLTKNRSRNSSLCSKQIRGHRLTARFTNRIFDSPRKPA